MSKGRLEAFSDGVIAILITIMVLELKTPHGNEWATLVPLLPVFLAYVLSFIYLGIYWNNHHHMLQIAKRTNGAVLWANLHLLFWLSLIPFTTAWLGENGIAAPTAAAYGLVLFMSAIAYFILQTALIRCHEDNAGLRSAVGRDLKGKASPFLYALGIIIAFFMPVVSVVIYVGMALVWLVPDRRIERGTV